MKKNGIVEKVEESSSINYYGKADFYDNFSDKPELFIIKEYPAIIYPAHFHSSIELYYIIDGETSVLVNGTTYIAQAGTIILVNSLDIHSIDVKRAANVLVFQFGEYYLRDFNEEFGTSLLNNFLGDKEFNERVIYSIMRELFQKYLDSKMIGLEKKIYVNTIFKELILHYGLVNNKAINDRVLDIIKYIYKNYSLTELGLKHIADKFGYAPVTISRIFSRYIGINIKIFINSVRMTNARNMIRNRKKDKMTMTEIASRCGFDSIATFYRYYDNQKVETEKKNELFL